MNNSLHYVMRIGKSISRLKLQGPGMVNDCAFGWVLWASIQEAVSKIDFDFRTWGMKKWNSVLPELTGNDYQQF